MIIPNNGETRKPTYKRWWKTQHFHGKMHVGQMELLAPPRETQKKRAPKLVLYLASMYYVWNTSFRCFKSSVPVGNGIILTFRSTYEKDFSLYCTDSNHHLTWNLRRHKKVRVSCPTTDSLKYHSLKVLQSTFFQQAKSLSPPKKTKNFPMLPTNNLSIVTLKQLSLLMLDPPKKTPQKATKTPLRSNRVHDWLQTTPGNESINPTLLFKRKQKVTSSQSQPTNKGLTFVS